MPDLTWVTQADCPSIHSLVCGVVLEVTNMYPSTNGALSSIYRLRSAISLYHDTNREECTVPDHNVSEAPIETPP